MPRLPLIRTDEDLLPLLSAASNEMLDPLVGYITDKGQGRWASSLDRNEVYRKHYPDHHAYWREIASEIQTFGGNTIANVFRGGIGVPYREVASDVAGKMSVPRTPAMDVPTIESQILLVTLQQTYAKMPEAQRRELLRTLGVQIKGGVPKALPVMAIQGLFLAGGFAAYQVAVIVANFVARMLLGRGLALVANAGLTRALGVFAGPIGWAVTGLWTAIDAASPAYRVTVPCVIQVAAIRQEALFRAAHRICSQGHENPKDLKFCGACGEKIG